MIYFQLAPFDLLTLFLTSNMDYTCEPEHSQLLSIQEKEPFNAEPPSSALVEFPITPEDLVYCRNHGPVRQFDEDNYSLTIRGGSIGEVKLTMNDLRTLFPMASIVAVLQVRLRRKEMGVIKKVHGVPWSDGVIANCRWGGVRLCDLLKHAGEHPEALHVCFESHATQCQDDTYYGASIPFVKAMKQEEDILVAYEMNNEPLAADHGGPLRIVVPGFLGARWVKWVDTITIASEESLNFYQQRDYKILPPHIESKESAKALWAKYPSMTALPLNSVIGVASRTSEDTLYVKGYAIPSPCGNVQAVEVTIDDGKTWQSAQIIYQQGKWSWTLWEAELKGVEGCGRVYCRAIDFEGNVQPREGIWNLRGVAYNGWGVKDWI
ncbi:molybdopterin binding oxidoreductase [Phlegmacium glaucopus]|nr:molybdopterin binding oxidoreductase [Phlegmacium glaucopus]